MATRSTTTATAPTSTTTQKPTLPHDKIAMRAYEKWEKRGRTSGHDKQDWMDAERELLAEMVQKVQKTPPMQRR